MKKERIDHDGLYKELIQTFFREFIELFFPQVAQLIDFSHVVFLSEELRDVAKKRGKRRPDLVAETRLKGEEAYILLHTEPSAHYQEDFNERMFLYTGRLYEKHRKRIVSIAVFGHKRRAPERDSFGWSFPFVDALRFRYLKLQLRHENWREYARSDNPVAAALLSSMRYGKKERVELHIAFLRMLFNLKLDDAKMELITIFFGVYMNPTDEETEQVKTEIGKRYPAKEAKEMTTKILNPYERLGYNKGIREGKLEGKLEVAARMLEQGWPSDQIVQATGLPADEIAKLVVVRQGV